MTPARAIRWGGLLVACNLACGEWAASLRRHTYPPSFEYVSKEQLHETMWQLGGAAHELDRIVAKPEISAADRETLVSLLTSMDEAAQRLGSEGERTNHPLLDEQRDSFRADLASARRGVQAEPPSYTLVRSASQACMRCHARDLH